MYSKIFLLALFACVALARPQSELNDFNNDLLDRLGPINPNPQYNYAYQVADEESQVYIAHDETRDQDEVVGTYSYVDANGALVTVEYTAGVNGYQETRTVQDNFITIRPVAPKPAVTLPVARPVPVVRPVRPVQPVQPVRPVAPAPAPVPEPSDDDLVAKIIAQLTPFIRDTVSNSLQANQARSAPAPVPAPVPAPTQPIAPVAREVPAPRQAASVEGLFGVAGENNVRLTSPDFSFAYDLRK